MRVLGGVALAAVVSMLVAVGAAGQGSNATKVLVFHGGATNASVDEGVAAITQLGEANQFDVDATGDASAITAENLSGYRAVVALHSTGNALNDTQQSALQNYVQGGGGFVGIGEAANFEPGDSFFNGLIGARPAASSSNAVTSQLVEVGDRVHPATRELPLEWGPRSDAWYTWQQNPTGQVHTVARARFGPTADDGWRSGTTSRPISWCRDFQGGRSFYTGMGRTPESYSEADFRAHLLGAIQWSSGMVRGGCKATIAANYQTVRLSNGTNGLDHSGESHGVTIAPNGWAITITRAACGSDQERGARIGQPSFPRTLDFTNPNVGVGCAPIHVFDPEEYDGSVNSGTTRATTLTIYGDRGGGAEINGKIETGGLGITTSPDFAETGHIYVQYFPSFNPDNPVHAGLQDGAQRRITKMGRGRISRFTLDLDTKRIDLSSEVPIFEYDSQIYSCCHRGGGMGWDSADNLYVTTGDSNSSGRTGGYSGNFQPARCPTGPAEVSNAHCGSNGISFNDARRTAGSTNDYNGKMLRIKPIANVPKGTAIGVGSTYTIPGADAPNGPNLFDGSEGGGGLTKPEIYAMGLRNPSRLNIDPETDIPYSAWVGPDAGSPSATLGPSTYEVASQLPHAGNWGWPYCMGNKQAYRDRVADGNPRTANAAGFVTGGPAGAPTQGWYDCDNLVNDSTNNTGLTVLPHTTGTGRDAGSVRPANLWYSRGNPGGEGCPVFPRENGANGAPNYGAANNEQLCPYYDNLGGHTVMAGPVYRYDEDAADDSARWPEYWDGRWFVHDFSGGNAKSFGFLFDPETAEAGGQPSYVDKMSQYINWSGGSYMDSKYGTDGALYLQTYANYFEHGSNDGLHRVSYTGGPDTPGPDPQWENAGAGQIAFSIGRSGGIAYEWDFGDGSATSNEQDPTHTYAEPGQYDVTLTVTYADGEEASETVRVNASDDQTAPVTTHAIDPETPGTEPVEVTLSATDPAGPDPEPQTHQVNATPSTWEPNALEIASGDTVTWNFPSSANFQHDVWVIAPNEAPDSEGTQVTSGAVPAGGPPVSRTFEQTGTWTFLCKLHSFKQDGKWNGMVGTVDVAAGGEGAATGVASTEYRVNTDGETGQWQQSDNDGNADPFTTTFTVEDAGDHVVEYRSRDNAGNIEETKSVEFTIEDESTQPPGGACLPQSDEFEGTALDSKWSVLRQAGTGPQVTGGSLGLEFRQGDFIANDPLAENTVLQDAPDGQWTVTTRLDTTAIDANGEQAGLIIWKSESPNSFSKVVAIQSGAGNHQFEHIVTQSGSVDPPIANSITPAPGGQLPDQVLLRARSDGSQVVGEFSGDNGETWTRIGNAGHAAPLTGDLRVGLAAFRGSNGGGTATFDWFRVHQGADADGPVDCSVTCLSRSDSFDGALNTDRWSFRHPTTPATGTRAPRTEGGNLVLPLGASAVDQARQGQIAFLGQPLPDGDFTVEAKISAPGLDGDDTGEESEYAQVGFGVYQTDDDWIGVYQTRNGDSEEPGTAGGTYFEVKSENEGSRSLGDRVGQAAGSVNLPDYWLRVTRTGDIITAHYSLDDPAAGGEWVELTTSEPLSLSGIFQAEDGPVHIGPLGVNGSVSPTFEYIRFDPDLDCPDGGCHPVSDQFGGNELDPKWEILNPSQDSPPTVADGHLTLPVIPGDFYGENGSAQALLQQAPAESWVATAKIAHANIDTNGEAAGLALVNRLNPNHFVKTAIQYKSDTGNGQPGKWAERVLTANDDDIILPGESVPWPNSGALNLTGDYAWARFVYDAATQEITTWTSTDGTTFNRFGAAIPVDEYLSQPGGLRVGLFAKHDGSGDDTVQVDAFNLVAGTTDPQTPGDDCGAAGECPQNDDFGGDELDSKWEVRNPNPNGLTVGGGNLTLTTAQGDVFGGNFTAQNILLQTVPEGPWTATTKLDHTAVTVNGQAAGLVVYGQEGPNHFSKATLQYKNDVDPGTSGNQPGKWIERTLTTNGNLNGSYGGNFPNTGALAPPTDDLWIRATYDGTNVTTSYSYDGETFTDWGQPVPVTAYGSNGVTKIGLFVKHDGSGPATAVDFDSFTVDAESCEQQGDTSPPTTTHALDPATPDGDAGWYVSPVDVTLSATDNEGGSGVESTEYRMAGEETWTAYDGPITVSEDGRHEIEYRSTDAEGNSEAPKRVSFRIDKADPTTTARLNGAAPESRYDGPVEVDLDADDGDGSGVRATEVRVDGGTWQPYVEEEVILNSAADLENWEQAGGGGLNWMTEEGGFARTFGGLGMPWYPKEYGDFSLKLQWRDSSTGTNGNGGLFARFPHPEEAVDRPPAERYPCQVGSATSSPAWVAIYCGHEIQINDHQGDAQKTGSIYNFDPLNAEQAKIQPRGTWVDYELRVVGQTYTIIRNGEVINEFVNAPDQNSSRPGDPPTNARQFARGYIGLQNHGNADLIDYRNVRVLPLDEGSVQGPITVEGDGEHTVEYRSTDSAGNVEDVRSTTFTIGEGEADTTPPVTSHELDPATPGAGGTYDGPVDVTLSATDPDAGGPAPEDHEVNAQPNSWDPNALGIAHGDTVTWNFPASANFQHDVWLIAPDEAPDSAGTQVTDGPVEAGSGETASYTFDEAGTWTFVCKLHSFVQDGAWSGMVGTVDVAEDAPSGASGVDFTEYRVNGGEWQRSDNAAGSDPFETSLTVSDAGDHTVEYRSTDVAGNAEAVKSVAFSIADEGDPEAPTVQGFADPSSGAAPLRVQFTATGLDPQGGRLTYEWRFGDGAGWFGPSKAHVYRTPGTYTATVIATDRQGKTATDTIEIVVSEAGNRAPSVAAAADPVDGDAPLRVRFSAQAVDPDGPEHAITYLWDFDDGGADAFGRTASHRYMEPGTYTATVTATDAGGAFDTAQVEVVVADPPGNRAPTVQAAATPRSGTAPLRVRFTSAASDPDGDPLSTVWDFGDGQQAGGPSITHTYTAPGTRTATVTVTDPSGSTATDTVQITVAGTSGAGAAPFTPQLAPQGVGGFPPQAGDAPEGEVQGEFTRRMVRAPKTRSASKLVRRGLPMRVTCLERCRVRSTLRLSGERLGKSKTVRIRADRTRTLVVRLDRAVRRNLLAGMRQAGIRRFEAVIVTKVRTAGATHTVRRAVAIKR